MAQTIGQTLQKKRQERGLSIADVAHDTRIHSDTIRGLEADDYSVFASTTYARSFLLLYSRHLEVDADDALHDLASVTQQLTNSGSVALAPSATSIEPGESIQARNSRRHHPSHTKSRNPAAPLFLVVAVLLLLLIIPTFYFIGKKANSLEEATSILNQTVSLKEENFDRKEKSPDNENISPLANKEAAAPKKSETTTVPPSFQTKEAPPFVDQEFSQHRFPRPLSEEKPSSPPSKASSALPLRAIPITPSKPTSSKPDKLQNPD